MMSKKIQIYLIIFLVIIFAVFTVILNSELIIAWKKNLIPVPENTRWEIYFFAGKVTGIFSPIMLGIVLILDVVGIIDINENIIKPKGEENETK